MANRKHNYVPLAEVRAGDTVQVWTFRRINPKRVEKHQGTRARVARVERVGGHLMALDATGEVLASTLSVETRIERV